MLLPETSALAASMLKGEMYQNGQVGRTETKVLTYNGSGAETQDYAGIIYAKIANSAPDLHTLAKAVYAAPNGSQVEFLAADLEIQDLEGGQRVLATLGQVTAPVIISDITGVWVYAQPGYGYCSRIETETIHPIDPKFLPGVCLPVVELSTTWEAGATFTDKENKALSDAFVQNVPVVVRCNVVVGDMAFNKGCLIFYPATAKDGLAKALISSVGGAMLQTISLDDGRTWMANIVG